MSFDASDLLWLLLPLAAGSGWIAARLDQKRRLTESDLPAAYFKGLNFLLNEQTDKAIEIFVQVLEVNSDTVETHLALGNLFRRRGEVDRAIRIHQNLIARPTLDKSHRSQALLELGQDYLKAGLFDRAENLFLELAEVRAHSEPALRFLMHIYQQERDWDKAIAICRKLSRVADKDLSDVIAQYHCELAEEALSAKSISQARDDAKRALSSDSKCVRASILLGDIEAAAGNLPDAIKAWRRVGEQDAHYLGEVAGRLAQAYRRTGDEHGMRTFFEGALQRHGAIGLMLAWADVLAERDGSEEAQGFVANWLRLRPSVQGLYRLIELNLAQADASIKDDLSLLKGIIEQLLEEQQGYVCQQCGFRGKSLHWQCPGCHRWNTVKPAGEEAVID